MSSPANPEGGSEDPPTTYPVRMMITDAAGVEKKVELIGRSPNEFTYLELPGGGRVTAKISSLSSVDQIVMRGMPETMEDKEKPPEELPKTATELAIEATEKEVDALRDDLQKAQARMDRAKTMTDAQKQILEQEIRDLKTDIQMGLGKIKDLKDKIPVPGSTPPATTSTSEIPLRERLEGIVIPRIELQNTPITDAIEFVRAQLKELDPDHSHNIIVEPGVATDIRLTLSLSNIPATEALRYICQLGDLEWVVDTHAVVISPR